MSNTRRPSGGSALSDRIASRSGVRQRAVIRRKRFRSNSRPGNTYEVMEYDDGSRSCNCPGWTRHTSRGGQRSCKHVTSSDDHPIAEFIEVSWERDRRHATPYVLPSPPPGRQWHRTDGWEGKLPQGHRPLMLDELMERGDEFYYPSDSTAWERVDGFAEASPNQFVYDWWVRTRRPLLLVPNTQWQLPAPPAGMQWHRDDVWIEHDLPAGYRPLLLEEMPEQGDEMWLPFGEGFGGGVGRWVMQESEALTMPAIPVQVKQRTRRPLPETREVFGTHPPDCSWNRWHRNDFNEAMLEGGWRPLLLGETIQAGDSCICLDRREQTTWGPVGRLVGMVANEHLTLEGFEHPFAVRTMRPIPSVLPLQPLWCLPSPPEGQRWHRNDWQQASLPQGYRPLLLGETVRVNDEQLTRPSPPQRWVALLHVGATTSTARISDMHIRTRRPLPSKAATATPGGFMRRKRNFS